MHTAAFRAAGLHGTYEARRVPAAELPAALAGLRQPGVLGANLSLPHKEAALPWLDELTPAARAIGAVNTVIHRQGRLTGENTDAQGLFEALLELGAGGTGDRNTGGAVAVLGAGGAARAAVYVAVTLLERDVYILNRTRARAQELAESWAAPDRPGPRALAADPGEVPWEQIRLLVNASSAGLDAPGQTPLPDFGFTRLPAGALVYDMVYKPAETRLMREARAAGRRAENGLGMLAHQARLAFRAWTGADVPVGVFLDALSSPAGREQQG
ncbi:shikimate dehydrogenase [Deinococcus koreensis]|uniref:Shikimate dehydrogenase n=2 Tax=Deinococcus koreensis TaxID=2054903 RepID=A0A2K3V1A0_9DEIO|nr:shikimate dehydrogenase [Deinococcus koreensis]